jgi:hypothetical protein
MPMSPENSDQSSIQQAADQHAEEILARRRESRARREAALAAHPQPLSIKTELTRVPLAAAVAPAPVSTTAQTAGYLLAVGDSWFDYPIHDILTRLDDNYGYNIESSAHRGDPIETMVSSVGQLDKFARCMDKIVALGDDIAGKEFGMLINNIDLLPPGWNDQVIAGVVDTRIAAAYRLMILSINSLCQKNLGRTFPILVHGYDYPVPDGRGFLGGGWLLHGGRTKSIPTPVAFSAARMAGEPLPPSFKPSLRHFPNEGSKVRTFPVDPRPGLGSPFDWWNIEKQRCRRKLSAMNWSGCLQRSNGTASRSTSVEHSRPSAGLAAIGASERLLQLFSLAVDFME